uniref:Uncharacterized protein n=1 Tax=Glossina palpalis gambiensis TaxID=67801 RepID=A0A1B0BHJ5_9MUSC
MTTLIQRFALEVRSTQALLHCQKFSYLALLCKQTPSYVYLEKQQRSIIMILQLAASFALRFVKLFLSLFVCWVTLLFEVIKLFNLLPTWNFK